MRCRIILAIALFLDVARCCMGIDSGNIVGYETTVDHGKTNVTTIAFPADAFPQAVSNSLGRNVTIPLEPRPKLFLAEVLSYATIRIYCVASNGLQSAGTGFFFSFRNKRDPQLHMPVIISNRHVLQNAALLSLLFTVAKDGRPSKEIVKCDILKEQIGCIGHPDPSVDLCALPIAPILTFLRGVGKPVFISPLDSTCIPDAESLTTITQLDEVVMIGYPGGLIDEKNNQPIFRRGTLATNPSMDYKGREEFLIDMPVFWGSSGSPVILYSEGAYFVRSRHEAGTNMRLGNRVKLLGIAYATLQADIRGTLQPIPIPSAVIARDPATSPVSTNTTNGVYFLNQFKIPNNLGVVIKASRLLEFEEHLNNMLHQNH